jgi:hypothetical protein
MIIFESRFLYKPKFWFSWVVYLLYCGFLDCYPRDSHQKCCPFHFGPKQFWGFFFKFQTYFLLFQFHSSTLVYWILNFIIYFNLLYMGLSWSHDSCREFCRITMLTRVFFCPFFNWIYIFFQLHPSKMNWLRTELHIFFLLSMKLSRSPDPSLIGWLQSFFYLIFFFNLIL